MPLSRFLEGVRYKFLNECRDSDAFNTVNIVLCGDAGMRSNDSKLNALYNILFYSIYELIRCLSQYNICYRRRPQCNDPQKESKKINMIYVSHKQACLNTILYAINLHPY